MDFFSSGKNTEFLNHFPESRCDHFENWIFCCCCWIMWITLDYSHSVIEIGNSSITIVMWFGVIFLFHILTSFFIDDNVFHFLSNKTRKWKIYSYIDLCWWWWENESFFAGWLENFLLKKKIHQFYILYR